MSMGRTLSKRLSVALIDDEVNLWLAPESIVVNYTRLSKKTALKLAAYIEEVYGNQTKRKSVLSKPKSAKRAKSST